MNSPTSAQAQYQTFASPPPHTPHVTTTPSTLPFTGVALLPIALIAVALIAFGILTLAKVRRSEDAA